MSLSRAGALLIGFGGAIAVGLVGWIGAQAIGIDVRRAGWAIPACIAVHALQLFLSAIAWRQVSGGGPPGLRTWFAIRWIRESVNSLLPVAQLGGTLVGVRLLALRGRPAGPATAAATLDITLESLTLLLFTLAGIAALAAIGGGAAWQPWLGGAVLLMGCASCGFLLALRAGLMRVIEAALVRLNGLVPALPTGALRGLHAELMERQRHPAALAGAAGLHLLAWALGSVETWLALAAMGERTGVLAVLVIESLGMAARSAGFAVPGSLGVQEGGFVLAGGLVGLPPDAAVALSMVKRARELLVGLPGLLAWQWTEGRRLTRRAPALGG
jgi:putative membrane protein